MPPPSQLQIALSSLQRLVKEEASYHKEMEQQKSRIAKLEATVGDKADGDGNEEYQLKQEVRSINSSGSDLPLHQTSLTEHQLTNRLQKKALEETEAVIPGLREKITNAREKTETLLVSQPSGFILTTTSRLRPRPSPAL